MRREYWTDLGQILPIPAESLNGVELQKILIFWEVTGIFSFYSAFLHSRTKNSTILIHIIHVHNKSLKATKLSTIKFSVLCFIINHNFSVTFMVLILAVIALYLYVTFTCNMKIFTRHSQKIFTLLYSPQYHFCFYSFSSKYVVGIPGRVTKKNGLWTVPFIL